MSKELENDIGIAARLFEQESLFLTRTFEQKQELDFEFFVADRCTGFASFGDVLVFRIDDIYHDLKTNQPKGLIIDWLYDSLEHENQTINYRSYCMGARFEEMKK